MSLSRASAGAPASLWIRWYLAPIKPTFHGALRHLAYRASTRHPQFVGFSDSVTFCTSLSSRKGLVRCALVILRHDEAWFDHFDRTEPVKIDYGSCCWHYTCSLTFREMCLLPNIWSISVSPGQRCCYCYLQRDPSLQLISTQMAGICFGVSEKELGQIPMMLSITGEYGRKIPSWTKIGLFSLEQVETLGISVHGSQNAMKRVCVSKTRTFQTREYLLARWLSGATSDFEPRLPK